MLKFDSKPLEVQYSEDGTTLTFSRPHDVEIFSLNRARYAGLPTLKTGDGLVIDFARMTQEQCTRLYTGHLRFLATRLSRIENLCDIAGKEIDTSRWSDSEKFDFLATLESSSPNFHDFVDKLMESKKKASKAI